MRLAHTHHGASLSAGYGPDDAKRLFPLFHGVRQWGVRRLIRKILPASEEPQKRSALLRDMVADRSRQHRITSFKGVENRALRGRTIEVERYLSIDLRQRSQMLR